MSQYATLRNSDDEILYKMHLRWPSNCLNPENWNGQFGCNYCFYFLHTPTWMYEWYGMSSLLTLLHEYEATATHKRPESPSHNDKLTRPEFQHCVTLQLKKKTGVWDIFLQYQLKTDLENRAIATSSPYIIGIFEHPLNEWHKFTIGPPRDTVKATGRLRTISILLYASRRHTHQASKYLQVQQA